MRLVRFVADGGRQSWGRLTADGATIEEPRGSLRRRDLVALAASCDTYFYELGYRFYKLPPDRGSPLQEWAARLGFGRPTRIDILSLYDASKLRAVLHRYAGRTDRKRDGFVFVDPDDKPAALVGIMTLT
jgi:cell division protein FtsI/penicillin-binding protein 2